MDQAQIVADASRTLAEGIPSDGNKPNYTEIAGKIRDLENKGDVALRNIYRRLHKTFITPFDPEDLHQLASLVDEVLDHLEASAFRLDAFAFERTPQGLSEVALKVNRCVEATLEAVKVLQREGLKKPDELTGSCEEINNRELDTENLVREKVRELYATEKDPIALLKQKDIYELLESTADCCENLADVLESIAVKNS